MFRAFLSDSRRPPSGPGPLGLGRIRRLVPKHRASLLSVVLPGMLSLAGGAAPAFAGQVENYSTSPGFPLDVSKGATGANPGIYGMFAYSFRDGSRSLVDEVFWSNNSDGSAITSGPYMCADYYFVGNGRELDISRTDSGTFTFQGISLSNAGFTDLPLDVVVSAYGMNGAQLYQSPVIPVVQWTQEGGATVFVPKGIWSGVRELRIVTANSTDAFLPNWDDFKYSLYPPPAPTTGGPGGISAVGATLGGTVNPNGDTTTVVFQYGTSTTYTKSATATQSPATGSVNVPVSAILSGLSPNTTYHYRLATTNGAGTTYGKDSTFTTLGAPSVASISPSTGSTPGGTAVTVTGTNFTGATAVKFGTTAAIFSVNSATSLTATAPAGSAGAVDVTVTTPGGTSSTGASDKFTYVAPATATTSVASSITSGSATLNGSGIPSGLASIGYFRYSTTNPVICDDRFGTRAPSALGVDLGSGNSSTPFSASVTGLTSGATYYYCAIVSNSDRTAYGAVLSLTVPGAPTGTTTLAATPVTSNSATLNGSSIPNGKTSYGYFRYSTTDPVTCSDAFGTRATATAQDALLGSGTSDVAFSRVVAGLLPATTYYVCAFGRNEYGLGWGSVKSFSTPAAAPGAATGTKTAVGSTGATVSGTVEANNSSTTDSVQYGTTSSYGATVAASPAVSTGTDATSIAATLSGLLPNTTYHYRVKAVNVAGTAYGADSTFTTAPAPQTIDFGPIPTQTYGTPFLKLAGTATSGLAVAYSSGNPTAVRISHDTAYLLAADTATVTASQAGDATYAAAPAAARRITVDRKAVSIVSASAGDKVYDGTTSATVTGGTPTGVVNSDEVSLVLGSATFADKDTGASKPVTVTGSTLAGTKAGNYRLTEVSGLKAAIRPKPIAVKANAQAKSAGMSDPVLTYDAPTLYPGDSWSGTLVREPGEAVGNYRILLGTLSAGGNYSIAYEGAKLAIQTPSALAPRTARPSTASHEPAAAMVHSFASRVHGTASARLDVGRCDESSPCLWMEVALPGPATVSVSIFDNLGTPVITFERTLSGQEWRTLSPTGDGRSILPVSWNLRSTGGEAVPSGVYLWKIAVVTEDGRKLETVKKTGVR